MTELSPETRSWIDAASTGDGPRGDDKARIRHRLTVELGAAAFATAALAATAQATAASGPAGAGATVVGVAKATAGPGLFSKLVVAAAVAGAVTTAAVAVTRTHRTTAVTVPATTDAQGPATRVRASQADVHDEPEPIAEPPTVEPEPMKRAAVRSRRPTVTQRPADEPLHPASPSAIADELALLRQAQTALRAGRLDEALGRANEHALRFPDGALGEERAAVTMLVHCTQHTASGPMLRAYLADAPESPLKTRVREACGGK